MNGDGAAPLNQSVVSLGSLGGSSVDARALEELREQQAAMMTMMRSLSARTPALTVPLWRKVMSFMFVNPVTYLGKKHGRDYS